MRKRDDWSGTVRRWVDWLMHNRAPSGFLQDWGDYDLLDLAQLVVNVDEIFNGMMEPDFDEEMLEDNYTGGRILGLNDTQQGQLWGSIDAIAQAVGNEMDRRGYDYDALVNAAYGN